MVDINCKEPEHKETKLENIELRVVGGWVRDHLLNVPCNDLDITIKGIDPKTFAELLKWDWVDDFVKDYFFQANTYLIEIAEILEVK